MRRLILFPTLVVAAAIAAPAAVASPDDFAFNILPPGQFGGLPVTANSTDQIPLYDGLHAAPGRRAQARHPAPVQARGLPPQRRDHGRPRPAGRGCESCATSFGVPHIHGDTRADVWFGAGYVTAQDRSLLLTLGRGPARAAVAEVPGVNAFGLITSGRTFVPSEQSEALVTAQQEKLVQTYGDKGRQILRDLQAYADGITAAFEAAGATAPWTVNDAIAVTAFIGSIFGNGGGDEVRNSEFLARLRSQLGPGRGSGAFVDLMEADNEDTPTTTGTSSPTATRAGRRGPARHSWIRARWRSCQPPPPRRRRTSSLPARAARPRANRCSWPGPSSAISIPRSCSRRASRARAARPWQPGAGRRPYVLIGRTANYAWSLTTATSTIATSSSRSCASRRLGSHRGSRHYRYRGECRPMTTFDAGLLDGQPVSFPMTVHGPVFGTATVGGRPYAITRLRSTYGEDALSMAALRDMTLGRGRTIDGFYSSANQFGFTFNWAYANRRRTAFFSSGKLPYRAAGTNKLLPTLGTGSTTGAAGSPGCATRTTSSARAG